MGAVGGGMFHLLKGMKNSPKGSRMIGGMEVGDTYSLSRALIMSIILGLDSSWRF